MVRMKIVALRQNNDLSLPLARALDLHLQLNEQVAIVHILAVLCFAERRAQIAPWEARTPDLEVNSLTL